MPITNSNRTAKIGEITVDCKMSSTLSHNMDFDNHSSEKNCKLQYKSNNGFSHEVSEGDVPKLQSKPCNGVHCNGVNKLHSKFEDGFNVKNDKFNSNSVLVKDHLTAEDLRSLFEDQICVLHIPNFIPPEVTGQLNSFLLEKGSEQYTHEIRNKDGSTELQYFGVNR